MQIRIAANKKAVSNLRRSPIYPELVALDLLLPFDILHEDDDDMVVQLHQSVVVSYSHEWSSPMLLEALKTTLRLEQMLLSTPFTLRRIHPNDFAFVRGRPSLFNLDTVAFKNEMSLNKDLGYFYNYLFPLDCIGDLASCRSVGAIGRGIEEELYLKLRTFGLLPKKLRKASTRLYRLKWRLGNKRPGERLDLLTKFVKSLKIEEPPDGYWSNFYGDLAPLLISEKSTTKQAKYAEILEQEKSRSKTLMDIGSNEGWFSRYAEKKGFTVVACDYDVPSIFRLYQKVRHDSLNILPLILDVSDAITSYVARGDMSFVDRFSSDILVALALSHHLILQQGLTANEISMFFSALCKHTLITDFVPKEDTRLSPSYIERIDERYSIEYILELYGKHFDSIEIYDSDPPPRKLLVCKK